MRCVIEPPHPPPTCGGVISSDATAGVNCDASAENPAPPFTDPANVGRVGFGEFQQFFSGSVDVATRAFRWGEVDCVIQGVTPESTLVLGRRYVSDLNFDGVGSVGQDWVSTLYDRIVVVDSVTLRHIGWNDPYNDPSFYFTLCDCEDGIDCPVCGSNPYLNYYDGNPVNGQYIEEHTGPQPNNSHYVLHERDGSQRDYDSTGKIIDRQDKFGNKISYSYDSSGRLSTVVDSVGRTFVVTSNTGGRITKIEFQDPANGAKTRLVSYSYTTGKLTQVTHADRQVGTWDASWNYSEATRSTKNIYNYDASGFLVGMQNDAGDVTLSITYDSAAPGKVLSQTLYPNPSDSTTWGTWSYTRINNMTVVVDPRDFKTEYDVAPGTNQVIAARRFITNLGTVHESRTIPPGHPAYYLYTFDRDTICNCGGPITKFTQPEGGAFQFTWDANFRITEVDEIPKPGSGLPNLVHKWTYDAQGQPASYIPPIGNASGNPATYTFTVTWTNDPNNPGWVQEDISLPPRDGRSVSTVWSIKRDSKGRIRETWNPDNGSGQRSYEKYSYYPDTDQYMARLPKKREMGTALLAWQTYIWDNLGNLTSASESTGANGASVTHTESFDTDGRCIQWLGPDRGGYHYEHRWRYDADGRLSYLAYRNLDDQGQIQASHEWIVWGFKYDNADHLLTERHEVDINNGQSVWALTQHSYDEDGLEYLTVDPDGVTTKTVWDERELPWKVYSGYGSSSQFSEVYSYTDDGQLAVDEAPVENGARTSVTNIYDGYDRLLQIVLANGSYSQLTYDEEGRHTSASLYASVGGQMREVRRNELSYDDWHSQPTEIRRVVKDELALTTLRTVYNRAHYAPSGALQSLALNGQMFTTFQYDEFGRLWKALDTLGNQEEFQYQAYSGWLTTRILTHIDPATGLPTTVTQSFITDEVGRVTATTTSGGGQSSTASIVYDSADNILRAVDPDGFTSTFGYRLDGLLLRTEEWINTSGSNKRIHLQQWTPGGLLSRIVDDRGAPVDYLYNSLGRKVQEVTGDGRMWQYSYTDGGFLKSITDPQGIRIVSNYSAQCVPTGRIIYDSQNNVIETQDYTWTPAGNAKRITRTPTGGTSTYVEFGRDSEGYPIYEDQDGSVVNYDHNALGLVSRITGPSGMWRSFDYDVNARPTTIRDETGATVVTNAWLGPSRLLLSRQFGNGTQMLVGRDGLTRANSVRHEIASSHALIAQTTNGLTARGLVGYETFAHRQNKGNVYRYDGLGRVTDAMMGSTNPAAEWATPGSTTYDTDERFSIGAEDHRLQVTETPWGGPSQATPYVTDPLRQYYTQIGSVARTYSENGNLKTTGNRTFTYDWADHLVDIHDGATAVGTYTYDALGRRKSKTVNGVTTRFVYAGAWIIEEYCNGVLEAVHDYADGIDSLVRSRRVDHADVNGNGNTTELVPLYFHADRLGSVSHVTTSAGQVVESYAYSAYGKPTIYDRNGTVVAASPIGNATMFTGREYDGESGLYYYRARSYEPDTGAFLQEDPLRFDGGIDLFEYAASSPMNASDPSGESWDSIKETAKSVVGALKDAYDSGALAEMALSSIPIVGDILDLLSAMTGYDITHFIATGNLSSLGCWDRIKLAAWAAADLAGSAIGAGIAHKLENLLKWLKDLKNSKVAKAAEAAASKLAGACGCFAIDTLVLTSIGPVPIRSIDCGDEVLTSPTATASGASVASLYRVVATTTRTVPVLVRVTFESSDEIQETIAATPEHLVFNQGAGCWVALSALRQGDRVSGDRGSVVVTSRTFITGDFAVANLLVAGAHTFRVGNLGILVHNAGLCGLDGKPFDPSKWIEESAHIEAAKKGGVSVQTVLRNKDTGEVWIKHELSNDAKHTHFRKSGKGD
jgi:RHS repeat-associated protein